MTVYYNEIEPYTASWLRNLIAAGYIADGEVDTRSIVDVQPLDLRGFTQCHFFAGIGGWSHALRLAGWSDDRPIWTGSCPCQPFSVAGKGAGTDDPRHLWPYFYRLIAACRPPVVMGEQVAGAAGYGWLDGVRADLARENYASRGVDIPACAVDAPHIRQRLYWVAINMADANRERRDGVGLLWDGGSQVPQASGASTSDMADAANSRCEPVKDAGPADLQSEMAGKAKCGEQFGDHKSSSLCDMADPGCQLRRTRSQGRSTEENWCDRNQENIHDQRRSESFWSDAIWLTGADGKARRSQPGLPLLAHGVSNRVGRLRAYGNAIVPQVAAEVIKAFMECEP